MIDISLIVGLADKLGALQAVKAKLLLQPDEASNKLVLVLDELSKVFTTFKAELTSYLSLYFDPNDGLSDERTVLLKLEGGAIDARVAEARGHCHKIVNVYENYLRRWFERMLRPDEAQMLEGVFYEMTTADESMLAVLGQLVDWLASQTTNTLDIVDAGDYDEANQMVRAARKEILPARRAVVLAVSDLRSMQAEFIAVAKPFDRIGIN